MSCKFTVVTSCDWIAKAAATVKEMAPTAVNRRCRTALDLIDPQILTPFRVDIATDGIFFTVRLRVAPTLPIAPRHPGADLLE